MPAVSIGTNPAPSVATVVSGKTATINGAFTQMAFSATGADGSVLLDAVVLAPTEIGKYTQADLDAMKQARFTAWQAVLSSAATAVGSN